MYLITKGGNIWAKGQNEKEKENHNLFDRALFVMLEEAEEISSDLDNLKLICTDSLTL